jgi:glycosyltransferase involved in cell wall biosynthesis
MPLKIHLIRTRYPHWGAHSGINQFVKYLDPDRFHARERLASDSDEDFPLRHPKLRARLRAAVQSRGMPWYKLSDLAAELDALRRSWTGRIDLIHYLDGEHSAQYLPRFRRRRLLRAKLIGSYHQPPEVLDTLVNRSIVSQLDFATVVSPVQLPYFRDLLGEERVRLILHGIDVDFFRPAAAPRVAGKFRCITVGHYLRDYRALGETARKLEGTREIEFHVVSSQAAALVGRPNVTIHRGIDDDALLKIYQQSDVLFIPLLQSTCNNAILEAIACGLPVISTALPSVQAYLPGGEAVLLKENDPDLLSDAVLRLAHHPEERRRMGNAARRRAEELDWRRIAPEFAAIYSSLAGSR